MAVLLSTLHLATLAPWRFSLGRNRPSSCSPVHLGHYAPLRLHPKLGNVVWTLFHLARTPWMERGEDGPHANLTAGYSSVDDGHAKSKIPAPGRATMDETISPIIQRAGPHRCRCQRCHSKKMVFGSSGDALRGAYFDYCIDSCTWLHHQACVGYDLHATIYLHF